MIMIRADANEHIGIGHVMRCLSIARAFAARGEEVLFVTADRRSDGLISGFNAACLGSDWKDMESEIPELERIIEKNKPSLLLIDSYCVTERYFTTLSRMVRTAYIDDLNAKRWDVDYLINYNISAPTLDYSWYNGTKTAMLLGPRYAPIREEFRGLSVHSTKTRVTNALVSAGGSDPERVAERIIREVCPSYPDIRFHIIVGSMNARTDVLKGLETGNIALHINERHMRELMAECDVAVSAAGTTLYELCASGIPTITYSLADNQIIAAEQFEAQGIMFNAGDCRGNPEFGNRVKALLLRMDAETRRSLTEKMQRLVDGMGAGRIAERLTTRVTLEPCREMDFDDYYAIRCGQSDIFWMGYAGPSDRSLMERVFMSRLGGNRLEQPGDKRIFMIKAEGRNVGFIQFSLSEEGLEFGYSVLDAERGKGYGSAGMRQATEIARGYSDHCFAHIRDDNIASQKAMTRAGLIPTDDVEMRSFPESGMVAWRKYILRSI